MAELHSTSTYLTGPGFFSFPLCLTPHSLSGLGFFFTKLKKLSLNFHLSVFLNYFINKTKNYKRDPQFPSDTGKGLVGPGCQEAVLDGALNLWGDSTNPLSSHGPLAQNRPNFGKYAYLLACFVSTFSWKVLCSAFFRFLRSPPKYLESNELYDTKNHSQDNHSVLHSLH